MMPEQLEEPIYRILKAQQANIARIKAGLVLDGTDGAGNQIALWGPRPDLVRLWDHPLRFVETAKLKDWERIITLAPIRDSSGGRFAMREDRIIRYQIHFLVRLTEREQGADADSATIGVETESILAQKVHRLKYDFHHVFWDRWSLIDEDCPQGLLDHTGYTMDWAPEQQYPFAMMTAAVEGTRAAW